MQDLFAGQANFNSIKVQLKHYRRVASCQRPLFQFHKGTIKTINDRGVMIDQVYFNSIKVQLKL